MKKPQEKFIPVNLKQRVAETTPDNLINHRHNNQTHPVNTNQNSFSAKPCPKLTGQPRWCESFTKISKCHFKSASLKHASLNYNENKLNNIWTSLPIILFHIYSLQEKNMSRIWHWRITRTWELWKHSDCHFDISLSKLIREVTNGTIYPFIPSISSQ